MKPHAILFCSLLLFSCHNNQESQEEIVTRSNASDTSKTFAVGENKITPDSEKVKFTNPEDKLAISPNRQYIWCCNSTGHRDPSYDRCGNHIVFNSYRECDDFARYHVNVEAAGHSCGCR